MSAKHALEKKNRVLKVERLSMIFGGLVAVDDISFEVERGKITAIIGPNGAGKTTVFNCLTGFYRPTVGRLSLYRQNGDVFHLERLYAHECSHKAGVARTFQNIRLFRRMSVLENLLVAQHHKLMRASGYSIWGLLGLKRYRDGLNEAVEKARELLEEFEIVDYADEESGSLPYGLQRRVEIARAVFSEPELLCLDEPAAGLNPRESASLNELLMSLRDNHGFSILLIEHDMSVVMSISDEVIVLDYGRKISSGTPKQVKQDKRVLAAYLGEDA